MLLTTTRTDSSGILKSCAIVGALLAPFLIYFTTVRSIVAIWDSSDTFVHGYIILPISLWLIWKRRNTIPMEEAAPFWPALLLLAGCGFGWLLAALGGVQVVRQYAFVAMIPLTALAVLGVRVAWSIAFPLLFLFLAVPFGEIFIGPLIDFTANFTVAALQLTGIPVFRNGTHFDLPTGSWSVVEACSGVRYLISSFTLGCLYAYLTYSSPLRRAAFMVLSILVPILANGLRAYIIVMIGHLSGMKLATGVDHLIYGWLFFGLVMFIMFWIGGIWREDQENTPAPAANAAVVAAPVADIRRIVIATLCGIACMAVWPLYGQYLERAGFNPEPVRLTGFRSSWHEASAFTQWKPRFAPANAELHKFFQRDAQQTGLALLYYRHQRQNEQLISSVNHMVTEQDTLYRQIGNAVRQETIAGRMLTVREATMQDGPTQFVVWYWYWIDGAVTANDYKGKLLQAKEKFLMRGDDGAAVMVFAPYAVKADEARATLRDYLNANLASVEATLASNRKQ
jgi:exosortase A